MNALKNAFKGFDINELDFSQAGNWPIGVKIISYIIIMVAIVAAGWHFYATDKMVQLEKEIAKEQKLKNTYKGKAFQVASLDALRQQMKDVESKFAELLKQLPTEKEVPGLLDDITNLGTSSGLDIRTIQLKKELKREFYIELPIDISVQGKYHEVGQFVSGIAGLSRIVTLHDYSISPSSDGVSMNIKAKTYRYDDKQ